MKLIGCSLLPVIAAAGNDIVNQKVIPDSRTPLIECITFLVSDIVDGQGKQFFFLNFIGIFIIHDRHLTVCPNGIWRCRENVWFIALNPLYASLQHFSMFHKHFFLVISKKRSTLFHIRIKCLLRRKAKCEAFLDVFR